MKKGFEKKQLLEAISNLELPKLDHLESRDGNQAEVFRDTLKKVAQGELKEPLVEFVYQKQGDRPQRVPGIDYRILSADPKRHFGRIEAVALNRKGKVWFRIKDYMRAPEGHEFGLTAIRPEGIISFLLVHEPSLS